MNHRGESLASRTEVADYLIDYISRYRIEYDRSVGNPPKGGGLPKVPISPYLANDTINCILARDGAVVFQCKREPNHDWWIAGGPALKIDYEPTVTPEYVPALLERRGLRGKSIGISRIVHSGKIPDAVWRGIISGRKQPLIKSKGEIKVAVSEIEESLAMVVARLTFGAFGLILDIHLERNIEHFWRPHIVTDMGFFPADLNSRRFINYMEMLPHRDRAAWNRKTINLRARSEVSRDFARYISRPEAGGTVSMGGHETWVENYQRSLYRLGEAISAFDELLRFNVDATEEVFHTFLHENSIILDVYGSITSKPRFRYPEGQVSPVGKAYVEPDFIISYPDGTYKLVELERASKEIKTQVGHPRQDIGQVAFQIAEWKSYISENYDLLRGRYPNISANCPSLIIISNDRQRQFSNRLDLERYMATLKLHYNVNEILTYDDVLKRAHTLYARISNLAN
jgi:hypothetical protein